MGIKENKKRISIMRDVDMTSGPLPGSLVAYAAPLVLTSMLQILYHAADIAVVGNFGSETSVASIGATSSIINFLVNVFVNVATGANILLARYRGAKDIDNVKKTIVNTGLIMLIVPILFGSIGFVLAPYLLQLLCTFF